MSKVLVAYFSAGGETAEVAKPLADTIGADLYRIEPVTPYTDADLNWMNNRSRSILEMSSPSNRPPLADTDANIAEYDTILLGFPIWCHMAPTIVNTFLEAYDFSGKRILLFATSGGNGFGHSVASVRPSVAADTVIEETKVWRLRHPEHEVRAWAATLKV